MRSGAALLLLVAVGTLAGCGAGEEAPAPLEEAAPVEEAPPAPEPEPARPAPPPPPPPPTTGELRVEGTEGANVVLDGRVLGTVPGAWEGVDAGEYPIRVE